MTFAKNRKNGDINRESFKRRNKGNRGKRSNSKCRSISLREI
jgi:hypothetical protein